MRLTDRLSGVAPSATLALAQKARELQQAGKDVVNLTVGEPDFPTPPHIIRAIEQALERGETKYTAVNGIPELREAIVKSFAAQGITYSPADVIVSTGAKQTLFNAALCLLQAGDEAIIPAPFWLSYIEMVRFAGAAPIVVETEESRAFAMTPDALKKAISPRTRVLFLNSPSNPAGALYEPGELRALADVLVKHPEITIISDEIYDSFVYGGRKYASLLQVAPELKDRTVVVNGCSKRYAMTGLRIGWAAGPKAFIAAMSTVQGNSTSNACSATQYGAIAALTGDQAPVRAMTEAFDGRRRFVIERLQAIPGVTCVDPRGAFYAFPNVSAYVGRKLPDGSIATDAFAISTYLVQEHALVVVPGGPFGAPNHIRLSFAASNEVLAKGLDRLKTALTAL